MFQHSYHFIFGNELCPIFVSSWHISNVLSAAPTFPCPSSVTSHFPPIPSLFSFISNCSTLILLFPHPKHVTISRLFRPSPQLLPTPLSPHHTPHHPPTQLSSFYSPTSSDMPYIIYQLTNTSNPTLPPVTLYLIFSFISTHHLASSLPFCIEPPSTPLTLQTPSFFILLVNSLLSYYLACLGPELFLLFPPIQVVHLLPYSLHPCLSVTR